jgi:antitoxin component of MazEF toxin-antitoxin module
MLPDHADPDCYRRAMEYTGVLESTGGNTAAFVIPDDFVEALAAGRRPKVKVTVGDKVFRTSIAKMGGPYWLGISKARREEAELTVGETYTLDIVADTADRTVDLPDDLAAALAGDKAALEAWQRLSFPTSGRSPNRSPPPRSPRPAPDGSPRPPIGCATADLSGRRRHRDPGYRPAPRG